MPTPELSAVPSRADASATENTTGFSLVLSGHFTCLEAGDLPQWPSRRFATVTLGCCPSLGDACLMALCAMSRKHFVLDAQEGHANGFAFETASFRPSVVTVYDLRRHKVLVGEIGHLFHTMYWFEPAVSSDEIRSLSEAARNLYLAADYQHGRATCCATFLCHVPGPLWLVTHSKRSPAMTRARSVRSRR